MGTRASRSSVVIRELWKLMDLYKLFYKAAVKQMDYGDSLKCFENAI